MLSGAEKGCIGNKWVKKKRMKNEIAITLHIKSLYMRDPIVLLRKVRFI